MLQDLFVGLNLATLDIAATSFCILLLVFMFFVVCKLIITMWNDLAIFLSSNNKNNEYLHESAKKATSKQIVLALKTETILEDLQKEIKGIKSTLEKVQMSLADKQKD